MQIHEHTPSAGSSFLPHGFCYLWDTKLLWTHVSADLLIGSAYVVISIALAFLVHRIRRDIPFSWVFVAFGLFIITCGLTHFMDIWTLWQPVYWLSGGVKVVTAVASVATAAAMPFTVPRAVTTIRDARLARERELAQARAEVLEAQNERLRAQALELQEQRAAAEALAARVELGNEQLRDALADAHAARLAAESANAAKSAFLRTMSHELRTPLNAIIGYEHLLEAGITGPVLPAQADQLRRIRSSAEHLLGLIEDVLVVAQSALPDERLRLSTIEVPPFFEQVAAMVAPQAQARNLELHIGELPDVTWRTDPGRLRQIVLNLLTNAVKFTAAGTVSLHGALDGDGALTIRVEDTGPGIARVHLEQIFEPFWQVEQGTTRAHGGSGLGLSVSRDLARRLGGTISVDSVPGQGSTFTVRLPALPLHADGLDEPPPEGT